MVNFQLCTVLKFPFSYPHEFDFSGICGTSMSVVGWDYDNMKSMYKGLLVGTCDLGQRSTMPQLRQSVTGFSLQQPGFSPMSVCVGFVMDKIALAQVFSK
jgi:hypothetical protein